MAGYGNVGMSPEERLYNATEATKQATTQRAIDAQRQRDVGRDAVTPYSPETAFNRGPSGAAAPYANPSAVPQQMDRAAASRFGASELPPPPVQSRMTPAAVSPVTAATGAPAPLAGPPLPPAVTATTMKRIGQDKYGPVMAPQNIQRNAMTPDEALRSGIFEDKTPANVTMSPEAKMRAGYMTPRAAAGTDWNSPLQAENDKDLKIVGLMRGSRDRAMEMNSMDAANMKARFDYNNNRARPPISLGSIRANQIASQWEEAREAAYVNALSKSGQAQYYADKQRAAMESGNRFKQSPEYMTQELRNQGEIGTARETAKGVAGKVTMDQEAKAAEQKRLEGKDEMNSLRQSRDEYLKMAQDPLLDGPMKQKYLSLADHYEQEYQRMRNPNGQSGTQQRSFQQLPPYAQEVIGTLTDSAMHGSGAQVGQTPDAAVQWARANPNDQRSVVILKKLGLG